MDKDSRTSKVTEVERRKRKTTSKKDEKKGRGKRKKRDNSLENVESNQSKEKKDCESPSTSRPPSPDPNCSICLGDLQNKSFTDSCFHMFCFVCLKEWSKVKAECPLCKQKFKNIIYNVRSYEKYDRYNIEEEAQRNQFDSDRGRFRYRTTLTFERRFTIGPEHNYTQPIARPTATSITTRSQWRRQRQPATSEFRRRVYRNGMRALEVRDRRLRTREVNPDYFRGNPAQMHRLVPWLNRELNSLLQNRTEHVQLVMEIVMGIIKSFPIDSEEFYQHVFPYVGTNTRHFMHEFMTFAKSPYNMPAYDSHVSYTAGTFNVDPDSNDSSSDNGDDDYVDEVIDIEDEREPDVERRGNPIDDMADLRPLFRSVRDILETETPRSSIHCPLSLSGWDSPTPGPSWGSVPQEFDLCSVSSPTVPIVENRESSPIDIGSSSDTDSDSTVSAESEGSDVVFVKMDKAWEERSPIMLSSDDTDDEVKRSVNKHYSKKKSRLKKKEHRKHKEHKKHKDSNVRAQSKEGHRHKKHKKHHSSDKSHRRSSSKHGEHVRSASKTKDDDQSRSSLSSDRHHKKKHKKHQHEDKRKKSRSSDKLASVIVLPNSSVEDKTSQPIYTGHLFPSGSSSTSDINDALQRAELPYKKHSSGHKRSGKLLDILPKLLEKGQDKINFKIKKSGSTSEKDKLLSTSSCPSVPNFTQSSQDFTPIEVSNLVSSTVDSNLANSTRTTNLLKSSVPFIIPDDILSLENSRNCLKCGLFYIPELLDPFDVCVTCKKKKVCETESRNFSDVFHELRRNQNTSSLPARNEETEELKRNSFTTSHTDNIVIQEGNETSLRPVLNQIDLTSVDALVESDTDDCELILANTVIDMACIDNEPKKSLDLTNSNKSPRKFQLQERSPLRIDFSNPPTPMSIDQTRASLLSSQSPPPWSLEVSNPPTPSSNDWPGYMAPKLPSSPEFPTSMAPYYLFPNGTCRLDGAHQSSTSYPYIDYRSSFSPMSCSSVYFDSFGSKYSRSKPPFIDLESDFVDLEKEDCQSKTATNMSVCSTENICLSDSDDSVKSSKFKDSEQISTQSHEVIDLNILNEICENGSLIQDKELDNENNRLNAEMDIGEEQKKSTETFKSDPILELISKSEEVDQDIEMTSKSSCFKNIGNTSENNKEKHLANIEYESNGNDFSLEINSVIEKHVPTSLAEKLHGLTDFSPSVLKVLETGKGLSFHNIISNTKRNVSNENICDTSEKELSLSQCDSPTTNNLETYSTADVHTCSTSPGYVLNGSLNFQRTDGLVSNLNENINSIDKTEEETSISFSATMNSLESDISDDNILNDNSENMTFSSSVLMENENNQNIGTLCDPVVSQPQSFPLLDSNTERSTLISTVNHWITDNRIQKGDNQFSSLGDINLDLEETCGKLETNNYQLLTINDDHQDSSDDNDNNIDSCEPEFDSSDSDLENCLSEESDGVDSNIESFRVDILHSEKDLSDNFSRIFESSDSD